MFNSGLDKTLSCVSFVFVLFGWSQILYADLQGKLLVNYEEAPLVIRAGEPAHLAVDLFDPENQDGLHHFHPMHEKPMHMVVISEDLQNIAHIHPARMGQHSGLFGIDINKPSTDPDNMDTVKVAPYGGKYFVFSESMPMGYPMVTLPLSFQAEGPGNPSPQPIIPDVLNAEGYLERESNGYKLSIKPGTYPHCGTFAVSLIVQMKKWNPTLKVYEDVKDLSPWLASFAHAVMISKNGSRVQDKVYYHLHAVWPLTDDPAGPRGPELRLTMDSNGPMSEGIFKFWIQFKHQNQVQTIPFVADIKAPAGVFPSQMWKFDPLCSLLL